MNDKNSYIRQWRENRKALGLCCRCDDPADPGFTMCQGCRTKQKAALAERRLRWEVEGLCHNCGKGPPRPGLTQCGKCSTRNKPRRKRNYLAAIEKGLCGTCCKNPAKEGLKICGVCTERAVERERKRRVKLKQQGVCVRCRNAPAVQDRVECETCTLKEMAGRLWSDKSRWPELTELLKNQAGRCPYTDWPIRVGLDASIDHRIPLASGGSNDLDNLQWVHTDVNVAKWSNSEDRFLTMCRAVVAHEQQLAMAS